MSREGLTIRAFKAVDEPDTCARYIMEHAKVLEDFGVGHVVAPDTRWTKDPSCHVIIAEHPLHGMVGGIKVVVDTEGHPLPIETAIMDMDPGISRAMHALADGGNGEVCGLWNANRMAGYGIPLLLSLAAVSIANQLGLRSLVCLVAHYTLRHALKAGFVIIEDVGDGGTFTYPIPEIRSLAMVIPDALTLSTARPEFRERLLSLRIRPEQIRTENPSGIEMEVHYDLLVERKVFDLYAYRSIQENRSQYSASA